MVIYKGVSNMVVSDNKHVSTSPTTNSVPLSALMSLVSTYLLSLFSNVLSFHLPSKPALLAGTFLGMELFSVVSRYHKGCSGSYLWLLHAK